jgi:hypothetical protein
MRQPGQLKPLVSVVMPTHDRPVWFAEALASVRKGEFDDYEIVVTNNGDPHRHEATIQDRGFAGGATLGVNDRKLPGRPFGGVGGMLRSCDDDRWSLTTTLVPPLEVIPRRFSSLIITS